jgi:hypothetical protein
MAKRKLCTWKHIEVLCFCLGKHGEDEPEPKDGHQDAGDCRHVSQGLPLQGLGQGGVLLLVRRCWQDPYLMSILRIIFSARSFGQIYSLEFEAKFNPKLSETCLVLCSKVESQNVERQNIESQNARIQNFEYILKTSIVLAPHDRRVW